MGKLYQNFELRFPSHLGIIHNCSCPVISCFAMGTWAGLQFSYVYTSFGPAKHCPKMPECLEAPEHSQEYVCLLDRKITIPIIFTTFIGSCSLLLIKCVK